MCNINACLIILLSDIWYFTIKLLLSAAGWVLKCWFINWVWQAHESVVYPVMETSYVHIHLHCTTPGHVLQKGTIVHCSACNPAKEMCFLECLRPKCDSAFKLSMCSLEQSLFQILGLTSVPCPETMLSLHRSEMGSAKWLLRIWILIFNNQE